MMVIHIIASILKVSNIRHQSWKVSAEGKGVETKLRGLMVLRNSRVGGK
jgi:hypothetical protein